MVEPISLQQILSMGTQVEKMQQVHQNQHDVSVRSFAQDTRSTLDEKKIEVPVNEEGSEIKAANDQSRQKPDREKKKKQQKEGDQQKSEETGIAQNPEHGSRVNIVV